MTHKMFIMRGVPGSGKSTFVEQMDDRPTVRSADSYFVNPAGVYAFDPSKLGEAHNSCFTCVLEDAEYGEPTIVVDNTNITMADLAPYVAVARAYDYRVIVVEMHPAKVDAAMAIVYAQRCKHGVSVSRILAMSEQWEPVTPRFCDEVWTPNAFDDKPRKPAEEAR